MAPRLGAILPPGALDPRTLERLGLDPAMPLLRLAGRSGGAFRADGTNGPVVLRLMRPGQAPFADLARETKAARHAADLGVGAEVLHADVAAGLLVLRWVDGDAGRQADFARPPIARAAGAVLRRLHGSGLDLGARVDLASVWDDYGRRIRGSGRAVPAGSPALRSVLAHALAEPAAAVPSHGDAGPANWILSPSGLRLIDWEYAAMHEPAWDLATLHVEAGLSGAAGAALLDGYGAGEATRRRFAAACALVAWTAALWFLAAAGDTPAHDRLARQRHRAAEALAAASARG